MTKRGSLFDGAKPAPTRAAAEPPSAKPETRRAVAPSREGKRPATAYLEVEAHTQLKVLAAKEQTSVEQLLIEGINLVFAARGLSRIA